MGDLKERGGRTGGRRGVFATGVTPKWHLISDGSLVDYIFKEEIATWTCLAPPNSD